MGAGTFDASRKTNAASTSASAAGIRNPASFPEPSVAPWPPCSGGLDTAPEAIGAAYGFHPQGSGARRRADGVEFGEQGRIVCMDTDGSSSDAGRRWCVGPGAGQRKGRGRPGDHIRVLYRFCAERPLSARTEECDRRYSGAPQPFRAGSATAQMPCCLMPGSNAQSHTVHARWAMTNRFLRMRIHRGGDT